MCRKCLTTRAGTVRSSPQSGESCPGASSALAAVLERPQRHKLAAAIVPEDVLLVCLACGAWASQRPDKLRAACIGKPTAAGSDAPTRLRNGFHPDRSRGLVAVVENVVPLWLPYGKLDRMLVEYIRIPDVVPRDLGLRDPEQSVAREAELARRTGLAASLIAAALEGGQGDRQ